MKLTGLIEYDIDTLGYASTICIQNNAFMPILKLTLLFDSHTLISPFCIECMFHIIEYVGVYNYTMNTQNLQIKGNVKI